MYESFARVYDTFMDNIPYEQWGRHIVRQLKAEGITDGIVLDLGCGTGAMTQYLSRQGYDMIGVDGSLDMLEIAREKSQSEAGDILYLFQDMREFELYGTVRAIVCICDSLNYLESEEDLLDVFRLVNNYLDPGGLFIFDIKTPHLYRDVLGDRTFAEDREGCALIWENAWYEEEQINEYDLSLFLEEDDGRYRRFEEVHCQRAFEKDCVISLLQEAGLCLKSVSDGYTENEAFDGSERLLFIAKETCKTAKET